jgi:hypothetical protein
VIGEAEELVAVFDIPVGDHFGEVIAVTPEGVGVGVAFEPLGFGGAGEGGEAEEEQAEFEHQVERVGVSE